MPNIIAAVDLGGTNSSYFLAVVTKTSKPARGEPEPEFESIKVKQFYITTKLNINIAVKIRAKPVAKQLSLGRRVASRADTCASKKFIMICSLVQALPLPAHKISACFICIWLPREISAKQEDGLNLDALVSCFVPTAAEYRSAI